MLETFRYLVIIYTYNDHGNLETKTAYSSTQEYDENDGDNFILKYLSDTNILHHYSYEYKNGKLFQENSHEGDYIKEKTQYYYNDSGEVAEKVSLTNTRTRGWVEDERVIYAYNEHGDVIKRIVETNDSTNEHTYSYIYDDQGNWISEIEYKNGNWVREDRREIEYFWF